MQLEHGSITVKFNGNDGVLLLEARPFGHQMHISLDQLEQLVAELSRAASAWRRSIVPNHYETLGVSPDATIEAIQKAYRRQMRTHHPDRKGGNTSRAQEINEAYETLTDLEKRSQYDKTLT